MKRLLLLLVLLLPCPALAWMGVIASGGGAGMDAGGACATQSYDVEVTSGSESYTFYDDSQVGNSWASGVSGDLYSISLEVNANASSDTITIRVDDDTDLSADYLVEFTCTVPASAGFFECVVPSESRPTLSASTTYYFLYQINSSQAYDLKYSSSSSYAGGQRYSEVALDWNAPAAIGDLNFKTRMCD